MHRIDGPGATVDNRFTDGDPVGGIQATILTDDWANDVQEELMSLLGAASIAPVKGTQNQVLAAVRAIISARSGSAGGFSFRNIIHNGVFNVNQRAYVTGTNTTVANQLTLDRWKVRTSGQNLTFSASGSGNAIVAPAGGLEQVVESINVVGGTYVASWTGAGTLTVNGVAVANGANFALPANTNATFVLVGAFDRFQVEPGTVATVTEVRPRAVELSLCQRYAYVAGSGAAQVIGWGVMATATAGGNFLVVTPVPLRATPTISDIGTGSAIQILSTVASAASAPGAILAQGNIVTFNANSASNNTVGAIAGYYIGATTRILFSADI